MLFDPVDFTSHLIFVHIYLTGSLCFYGFQGQQSHTKKLQNLFHTLLNNPINEKTAPKKEKKSKAVKDKGGGSGVGLTAVKGSMFFLFIFP